MSQLINPVGPEANNERAAEFEDHLVAFARTLGWDARLRNVDLYAKTGGQSKGVDALLAFDDPQLGQRHGLIAEAKIRHPLKGSAARNEVAALGAKVAALGATVHQLTNAEDIVLTRLGLLAYDASPFDPQKMSEGLSALELKGLTRAEWPREIFVIGPDTLVGLADLLTDDDPHEYYWPPFDQEPGRWGKCAPPQQVSAGMLACKAPDGTVTLWLRDALDHDDDFGAIPMIAWEWRIDVDRLVCSSVDRDRWRTMKSRWAKDVIHAANRDVGHVPPVIDARGLSFQSLTPFSDRWGEAA